jgi:hypothetical protein
MDTLNDYQWNIYSELVPTDLKNIPKDDHTFKNTSGHYAYTAYFGQEAGSKTTLYSELFKPESPVCMRFFYQLEEGQLSDVPLPPSISQTTKANPFKTLPIFCLCL